MMTMTKLIIATVIIKNNHNDKDNNENQKW